VLEVIADEGTDDRENLRVYCSGCHALVNWLRTYFGQYHPMAAQSGGDVESAIDASAVD
jgi:hypothetical protein